MTGAAYMPGSRLADYLLITELGRGAVGETFAARVTRGDREGQIVCVKVLAREYRGARSAERDAAVRYLRHEARVVCQLDHPNIARLLDSGVHEDAFYLVFELVDGANLGEAMAHGSLSALHVMAIGLEVGKALAFAHERDVLHRDVKPNNILIGTGGEVKLVDFGLAKLDAGAASQFSQHVGTPRYFAPEQLRGEPLTPATDVYALGLVLFELLSGAHPFYAADPDVFRQNVLQGVTTSSLQGRGLPPDLVAIVDCCLRPNASDRFISGRALQNALTAALAQYPAEETEPAPAGTAEPLHMHVAFDNDVPTQLGTTADRTADIQDNPHDLRTRIAPDPMEAYRRATKSVALEELARVAQAGSPDTKSVRGDLSRMARSVSAERSSGLQPAQQNRSGVRPADEATALGRKRDRAATTDHDFGALGTDAQEATPEAPAAVAADSRPSTSRPPKRPASWRSMITVAVLVAAGAVVALALLRLEHSAAPRSVAAPTTRAPGVQPPSVVPAPAPPEPTRPAPLSQTEQADTPSAASEKPVVAPAPASKTTSGRPKSNTADADAVSVTIGLIPYGEVIVDGKRVGQAPVVVKLAVGPHRIVGRYLQMRRAKTVVIGPETDRVVLDLRNDEPSK